MGKTILDMHQEKMIREQPRITRMLRKPINPNEEENFTVPGYIVSAQYEEAREARREMVRRLVIDHGRIDILINYVLHQEGADPPQWFHYEMLDYQDANQEALLLAFRGARKSTYCNYARVIFEIIRNPNIRILLVADATDQAKTFLRAIKQHFERNDELRATFGDYVTGAPKWTDSEIIVNKKTAFTSEATVLCAGVDTALPGRHFDLIIADDLVTGDNSCTEGQRNKLKNYFYKTLLPCLESPNGRLWIIGTRWHEDDLYGWLQTIDYKQHTFILGVLNEETDKSVWEERFPTKRMHRIRAGSLGAFELQWMCRSGATLGGIFVPDHFKYYDRIPAEYFKWQAVDLAAGLKDVNDFFAHVTLGITKQTRDVYLISYREAKLPFPEQVKYIVDQFNKHPDTLRVIIEANAYQIVMTQQIRAAFPGVPVFPKYTIKDKVARANQLATIATEKPFFVKRQHHNFIRRMCGFPSGPKDVFDAFEIGVSQGLKGAKKKRGNEPGLI